MTVDDFRQFFSDVSIGKVNTHHQFSDVRVDLTECCHSIIDFKVTTPGGPYTFSVSQKGDRMFPRGSTYDYSACKIILTKDGEFVKEIQKWERDTHLDMGILKKG
jgi:hypothetical protein